ncbi:MAG: ceramidase domain-containing protein [Cytophagaceae bacterium]
MKRLIHNYWFVLLAIVFIFPLWLKGPIPQDPHYHNFADGRTIFGIPNFHNVWTNFPFIIIGVIGIIYMFRKSGERNDSIFGWIVFSGFILVGLGSSYYHLQPDNMSLIWDRLPMTIIFTSFFCYILSIAYSKGLGMLSLAFALPAGILSIIYWYLTEKSGTGDLRPYIFVQFYPLLALPVIIIIEKQKFRNRKYLTITIGLYILAKVFEWADFHLLDLTSFSGHSVKHLLSAGAMVFIYRFYKVQSLKFRF